MENRKYKDILEICKSIQEKINLRTPFIKKIKSKYPSIRITHLSKRKIKIEDLKPRTQTDINEGGDTEPFGLYYSKNYNRLDLTPNKKKEIKFTYQYKYLYGLKFKNRKIYTTIDKKNPNLILVIRNKNDCDKFWELYGIYKYEKQSNRRKSRRRTRRISNQKLNNTKIIPRYSFGNSYFDFKKASRDFAGLEFKYTCGYDYFAQEEYGVIWNTDIIKDLVQMYPEK